MPLPSASMASWNAKAVTPDGHSAKVQPFWLARLAVPLAFVLVALALQASSFGNTNRHADETFYFLVGQQMHDGLLPYVDIWDRKPFGLFAIYYLIAGISRSVLAYQIIACLFAAATAGMVCAIVTRAANLRGGVLAGLSYLLVICPFEGITGQTPDFYNPLVAGAALLLLTSFVQLERGKAGWRVFLAMALCGIAITIKHTALFESLYLGSVAPFMMWRARAPIIRIVQIAAGSMLLGALPTLLIAGYYAHIGHWAEFWHAMVISNLTKAPETGGGVLAFGTLLSLSPLLAFALLGLWRKPASRDVRMFVALWLVAALIGYLSVPNFYRHYALPLVVPLAVAAGLLYGYYKNWRPMIVGLAVYSLLWFNPLQGTWRRQSNQSMQAMAQLIVDHDDGGGLLVFDAPPYLYALTGKKPLSPLAFPHHLNHMIENNVSHINTHAEIDRIIAGMPSVIALSAFPRKQPVNSYSRNRVLDYAKHNCRSANQVILYEENGFVPTLIFGDCAKPGVAASQRIVH
jgi:hypothetical protein